MGVPGNRVKEYIFFRCIQLCFSRYPETLTGNLNLSPNPGEGNVNPILPQRNHNNPFILPQEPNLPYLLHKNMHALDRRIPESCEVESVGSRGSKVESEGSRGSKKSDMGTSTDLSATGKIFRLRLCVHLTPPDLYHLSLQQLFFFLRITVLKLLKCENHDDFIELIKLKV